MSNLPAHGDDAERTFDLPARKPIEGSKDHANKLPATEADGTLDLPATEADGTLDLPATEADGTLDLPATEADGTLDLPNRPPQPTDPDVTNTIRPAVPRSTRPVSKAEEELPKRIGRFEIRQRLGEGAFGVVYRAYDPQLDREVALKVAKPSQLSSAARIERFFREARAAANLRHPNIVPLFETGRDDGYYYIAFAFIRGYTLEGSLEANGPAPLGEAIRIVRRMAEALAYAHKQGIVHRDVKPANVMIDESGEPLIMDFGLAARHHGAERVTQEGSILGTPLYMAPEQAEGKAGDPLPSSDQYSLGCVLFELLTGQTPFAGPPQVVLLNHIKIPPPSPRKFKPTLPRDLETIVLKCLEKEPARRYADCLALAEDLRRYTENQPILARRASLPERLYKWWKREPYQVVAAGSTLAVLLAIAGGAIVYAQGQQAEARLARRDQEEQQQREIARRDFEQAFAQGGSAFRQSEWAAAIAALQQAVTISAAAPEEFPLREAAEQMLTESRFRLKDVAARNAALEKFRRLSDLQTDAQFHAAKFTGTDVTTSIESARKAVAEALSIFGVPPNTEFLAEKQGQDVLEVTYELLLLDADILSQQKGGAKAALARLDQADKLGLQSKTYWSLRSKCLETLEQDREAVEAREKAEQTERTSASDYYLAALETYGRQRLPETLKLLTATLARQPDHFGARYLQATCLLQLQQIQQARAALTDVIARRPNFVWPYLLRSYAATAMNDFSAAEQDLTTAMPLATDAVSRYASSMFRGATRVRAKQFAEAEADFRAALKERPESVEAVINLAETLRLADKLSEAIGVLDQALLKHPESATLYHSRGRMHYRAEQRDKAIEDFRAVNRFAAASKPAYSMATLAADNIDLGRLLHLSGQHAEALKALQVAEKLVKLADRKKLRSDWTLLYRYMAEARLELGQYRDALEELNKFLQLEKGAISSEVYRLQGLLYDRQGLHREAVAAYTLGLSRNPKDAETLRQRGWSYLFNSAGELALADFEESLKLEPQSAEALAGRGITRATLNRVREAISDAEQAVKLGPPTNRLMYQISRIYAIAALRYAGNRQPDLKASRQAVNRSAELLSQSMEMLPASERAAFWAKFVRNDPALVPLLQTEAALQKVAEKYGVK